MTTSGICGTWAKYFFVLNRQVSVCLISMRTPVLTFVTPHILGKVVYVQEGSISLNHESCLAHLTASNSP